MVRQGHAGVKKEIIIKDQNKHNDIDSRNNHIARSVVILKESLIISVLWRASSLILLYCVVLPNLEKARIPFVPCTGCLKKVLIYIQKSISSDAAEDMNLYSE